MSETPHQFSRLAEELIADLRGVPLETPPWMKKRPTTGLGSLVEHLLVKHQIGKDTLEDKIRSAWTEVVGPANAHYSHASQIDARGRLTVLASHAVVRNELFHHRKEILARIRQLPGCEGVNELNIRAG